MKRNRIRAGNGNSGPATALPWAGAAHGNATDWPHLLRTPDGATHFLKNFGEPDSGRYRLNIGTSSGTCPLQIMSFNNAGTLDEWSGEV